MSIDGGYTGNAVQGEKYEAKRWVPAKEIAANVRKIVKESQKLGILPDAAQGFKYSVRSDSFSGGQAVRIGITAPDERCWRPLTSEDAETHQRPSDGVWVRYGQEKTYSDEIRSIGKFLNGMGNDYTRRDCDAMTDYFDVSCYITVTFNGGYCI